MLAVKVGIAARRQSLSPRADVGRAGVADVVVRHAVMDMVAAAAAVVGADKEEQAEGKQETVTGAATAGTHEVVPGRTKTRRDTRITIGNEDTTKKWPKWAGQAVDEVIEIFCSTGILMIHYMGLATTEHQTGQMNILFFFVKAAIRRAFL